MIRACEELGIGFVPFSLLASGFLAGEFSVDDTLDEETVCD
ncbi:hypothetical protein [Streptomyces sp. NPDC097610]